MTSPDRRPPTPDRQMSPSEIASLTENKIMAFRQALAANPGFQKAAAEHFLSPGGNIDGSINFKVGRTKSYSVRYESKERKNDLDDSTVHHERLVLDHDAYGVNNETNIRFVLDFKRTWDDDYLEGSTTYIPNTVGLSSESARHTNTTEAFRQVDLALSRLNDPRYY